MSPSEEQKLKIAQQMGERMRAAGMSMAEAAEAFKKLGLAAKQLDAELKKYAAAARHKELMERLREWYHLEGVDDENVDLATKGLLGRAIIELKMAWRDFWREVWK